jgi:hypothetical protein
MLHSENAPRPGTDRAFAEPYCPRPKALSRQRITSANPRRKPEVSLGLCAGGHRGPLSASATAAATRRLSRPFCRRLIRRRSDSAAPSRSGSASVTWRWLGTGAEDAEDEKSRVSASRYAAVHMAATAGRLSAAPGCGPGCLRDRGRRSRECRRAARPAPGQPRRRWPAAARRCRRGPWWPGGSSRRCPWPSSPR